MHTQFFHAQFFSHTTLHATQFFLTICKLQNKATNYTAVLVKPPFSQQGPEPSQPGKQFRWTLLFFWLSVPIFPVSSYISCIWQLMSCRRWLEIVMLGCCHSKRTYLWIKLGIRISNQTVKNRETWDSLQDGNIVDCIPLLNLRKKWYFIVSTESASLSHALITLITYSYG